MKVRLHIHPPRHTSYTHKPPAAAAAAAAGSFAADPAAYLRALHDAVCFDQDPAARTTLGLVRRPPSAGAADAPPAGGGGGGRSPLGAT